LLVSPTVMPPAKETCDAAKMARAASRALMNLGIVRDFGTCELRIVGT
jgi:hypothetical protein